MHVDENEEYISDLLSDLDKHFFFLNKVCLKYQLYKETNPMLFLFMTLNDGHLLVTVEEIFKVTALCFHDNDLV